MTTAAAQASPNIALIKYWGNRDPDLRIPANGSISINLDGLHTRTQVTFDPGFEIRPVDGQRADPLRPGAAAGQPPAGFSAGYERRR